MVKNKQGKDFIKFGDDKEMELTYGKVKLLEKIKWWGRAKYAGKVKLAYNNVEDRFFIQITHRLTQTSYRIYMTSNQFKDFIDILKKTHDITTRDLGEVAS